MTNTRIFCALVILSSAFVVSNASAKSKIRLAKKGSLIFTGNLGYSMNNSSVETGATTEDKPQESNLTLGPHIGYFVTDGFELGLDIKYSNDSSKDISLQNQGTIKETSDSTTMIAFTPAYYFPLRPSGALQLYTRAKIGYAMSSETTEDTIGGVLTKTELNSGGLAFGGGLGVAFAFGGRWGGIMHIGVDYLNTSLTQDPKINGAGVPEITRKTHSVSVGTGLGLYF